MSSRGFRAFLLAALCCALPGLCSAQNVNVQDAQAAADYRLRSGAHVDPATLALQLQIPLGEYPGRAGMRLPVTLYYSSKLWRVEHQDTTALGHPAYGEYDSRFRAETSKESAMGWTSSLDWFLWPSDRKVGPEKYNVSGKLVSGTHYDRTVARMYVTLPDGSKHELRRDDAVLAAGSNYTTGTFYSVDGSRLRYESASRTLFMPDGSRIVSEVDANGVPVARHVVSRNGNRNSYSYATGRWTDTLGRTYAPPPLRTVAGDYEYFLPGVGADLRYVFRWRNLSDVLEPDSAGNTPALRFKGDRSMSYPHTAVSPSLFTTHDEQNSVISNGSLFNPVVLSEIELPNGKKYSFKYNVWGEIVRVNYPMGAYELFTYGAVTPVSSHVEDPLYAQANRGVTRRTLVVPGAENGTSVWIYGTTIDASVVPHRLMRKVTAPDNSYTETLYHSSRGAAVKFGFDDARAGRAYDERVYSASGQMLRRTLTKWALTGPTPFDQNSTATRDARPSKVVAILLDTGGAALAATEEYQYDSDLNVISTSKSAYASVDPATAQSAAVDSIPAGALLRTDETDYLTSDPNYRARNLLSLPRASRVKDAAGNIVAKSEMFYDETALAQYGAVTGWSDPGTAARGNLTRTSRWVNTTNAWVETRAEYDQCGSPVKNVDARGHETLTAYSSGHAYAYPTSVTSAAPNPASVGHNGVTYQPGTFGSTTGLTAFTTYDPGTGLVTSTTDANGKMMAYDYSDPLNRVKRVERPDGGRTTYVYADDHQCGALIETRTLLDASGREVSSWQFFDALGRPYLSESLDGQDAANPYFRVDTRYDVMGRVSKVSNPYRTAGCGAAPNPSGRWTTSEYDALGRVWKVTTPDGGRVRTAYSGAQVLVTDQADRQRVSRSDALGRLTDVWEVKAADPLNPDPWLEAVPFVAPPDVPGVGTGYRTSYLYDVLGNLRTVTQGAQPARAFVYDSLSRLTSASNPESGAFGYTYDPNGNLETKTDARGVTTTYRYDGLNRNIITSYAGGGTSTPEVRRHYDNPAAGANGLGRPYWTEAVGVSSTAFNAYDAVGRPTHYRQVYMVGGAWGQYFDVGRTYDKAGNVLTQTYPSGHTVSYAYDAAGRLGDNGAQSAFAGNLGDGVARTYASQVSYDESGGIRQQRFGTQTPLYHKLHYNRLGQLYDVRLSTQSLQAAEWDWNRGAVLNYYGSNYAWEGDPSTPASADNNGNLRRSEVWVPLDAAGSYGGVAAPSAYYMARQTYSYDALNRLSSVTETHADTQTNAPAAAFTQSYTYDRWGNRTVNLAQSSGVPVAQYDFDRGNLQATNRLYAPGDTAINDPSQRRMHYDAAGNLTHDAYTGMGARTYDAENRMTGAVVDAQGNWAYYTYDADGRRVKRKITNEEWWQVYGMDGELLAEYQAGAAPFVAAKEYGYRSGELLVTMSSGDVERLRRFVKNLYYNSLARDASPSELASKTNQLAQAGAQGGETQLLSAARAIARGLFESSEYVARGRTPEQYVTDLYNAYLQRGPDSGGLNHWVGNTNQYGPGATLSAFEVSAEFAALSATVYGTAAGGEDQRVDTFVRNFYYGAFQREPTAAEAQAGRQRLTNAAAAGRDQVIAEAQAMGVELIQSTNYNAGHSVPQYVTDLYQAFLQRAPDGPGLTHWIGNTSQYGRAATLDAFRAAVEYRELAGTLYRETFWLVPDHLGTPRMLADRTGSLAGVKRHDYLPFGEELFAGAGGRATTHGYGAADNVRQKFTSKERDAETSLDYFSARYYGATLGRFTSVDPGNYQARLTPNDPQSWNGYSYTRNNPLRRVDRSGMGEGDDPLGDPVSQIVSTLFRIGIAAVQAQYRAKVRHDREYLLSWEKHMRESRNSDLIVKNVSGEWVRLYPETMTSVEVLLWADHLRGLMNSGGTLQAIEAGATIIDSARSIRSLGAMQRMTYEPSPKHGSTDVGDVSRAPTNGQTALDNSVQVKDTSTRRVGVDRDAGEIVVFDETHPGKNVFHGHVRSWEALSDQQRNALIKTGLTDKRGNILIQ